MPTPLEQPNRLPEKITWPFQPWSRTWPSTRSAKSIFVSQMPLLGDATNQNQAGWQAATTF